MQNYRIVQNYHPRFQVLSGVALIMILLAWTGKFFDRMEHLQRPNALSRSNSPYLRGCQHQTVSWHTWNANPFARAFREKKMIYVDVGALWSGRSLKADTDFYANSQVNDLIRESCVPIKVDADAREKTTRYLRTHARLMALPERYPLVVMMNSHGEPITAFSPQSRPLLIRALEEVNKRQRENPQQVRELIISLQSSWREMMIAEAQPGVINAALYQQMSQELLTAFEEIKVAVFDQGHPKAIANAWFLLHRAEQDGDAQARQTLIQFLEALRRSALYDTQRGSFHTLAEGISNGAPVGGKRLEENAMLLMLYARASRLPGGQALAPVTHEIVDGLRTLFWRERPPGFLSSIAPLAYSGSSQSDSPDFDPTFYVSANALTVQALLTYEQLLGGRTERGQWALQSAKQTMETLRAMRAFHGELYHSSQREVSDWLRDEAQTAAAAMMIYKRAKDERYLTFAETLIRHMMNSHPEPTGGFYDLRQGRKLKISVYKSKKEEPTQYEIVIEPSVTAIDDEFSADNPLVACALMEFAEITGNARYRVRAKEALNAFAQSASQNASQMAYYTVAVGKYLNQVQ